jgi:hypothetical protein
LEGKSFGWVSWLHVATKVRVYRAGTSGFSKGVVVVVLEVEVEVVVVVVVEVVAVVVVVEPMVVGAEVISGGTVV